MKKGILKKITAAALAASMVMSMGAVSSFAAGSTASSSSSPKIEEVDYEGNGRVDVDFYGKVKYKNVKVTVKDTAGKKYTAKVTAKDNDELDFKVSNIKAGKKYKFTISGIKKSSAKKYTSVKGSFKVPGVKKIVVQDIEYDAEGREVSFEFRNHVQWKNAGVSIKDANGKGYAVRIVEKDNDELDVKTTGLTEGETYTYKIKGIKAEGASAYTTITGTFTAYDD